MIKAVLFDFDGVLTIEKTGSAAITEYIAKRCGLPAEQVRICYRRYNQALLLGETTHAEIWPAFCEALGQKLDYQLLTDSFRAAELGSGKTDRRIFDYVLDQLDLRPEECVFIDNAGKNLVVPEQMGIRTLLFDEARDFPRFRAQLEAALAR